MLARSPSVSHAPYRRPKHIAASAIPWTPEQEDELRKLAAEGLSAAEISQRLSVPRSRSAVLGRAYRLRVKIGLTMEELAAIAHRGRASRLLGKVGLTMKERVQLARELRELRENNGKPRLPIRPGPVTEAEAQLFLRGSAAPAALVPIPTGPGRPPIQPKPEGRSVYELTMSCCRWIDGEVSDPRPYKCTGVAEPNSSWCAAHFKRAYAVYRPMRLQTRELA
jgi:hypothetical protein